MSNRQDRIIISRRTLSGSSMLSSSSEVLVILETSSGCSASVKPLYGLTLFSNLAVPHYLILSKIILVKNDTSLLINFRTVSKYTSKLYSSLITL